MIPLKRADIKLAGDKPRNIIIHHTAELVKSIPKDGDGLDINRIRKMIYVT